MPPLDRSGPPVSFFEFWPQRTFYAPMVLYWGWLSLRHGGPCLPTIANPLFPFGGWAGESKATVMKLMGGHARKFLAPWMAAPALDARDDPVAAATRTLEEAANLGLALPLVAKPDLGLRGAGVRRIQCLDDLTAYYKAFPAGERFILQRLIEHEGEAGVFYIRKPSEPRGRIFSLTLKYFPHAIGDGRSTLRQLIENDPRAGRLRHLYLPRHAARLDAILADGEPFRLAFAGSHSRGAIFRDGADQITQAMTDAFDTIAKDIQEFYFGRFDVRFADIEDLRQGKNFHIVEVNGAGAEATHIWDRKTTLYRAYATLMAQYRAMWEIGAENRARGFEPATLLDLLSANEHEQKLVARYPQTE
jgi:hypothetical protein